MFNFSRTDLETDLARILKTQLRNTAELLSYDTINSLLSPELAENNTLCGDLTWDGEPELIEELIKKQPYRGLLHELVMEAFDFVTEINKSKFWLEKDYWARRRANEDQRGVEDIWEYVEPDLKRLQAVLPMHDHNGVMPVELEPKSPVNQVINLVSAATKVIDVFKGGKVASSFSVSELANLCAIKEQSIRNFFSATTKLNSSPLKSPHSNQSGSALKPLKRPGGKVVIPFDEAIRWRSERRKYFALPIRPKAQYAAQNIEFEDGDRQNCPVYAMALIWNLGSLKSVSARLDKPEGQIQKILDKGTNNKELLRKIGKVLGIEDVDCFVKSSISTYSSKSQNRRNQ